MGKRAYLFGHNNVKIVLSLINVSAERHDAADTGRIDLAGTGTGGVHDAVLGVAEEVGRSSQTVEHPRAHDTGAVGVGIDIHLDGGVHTDTSNTTDDLGRVGHLLRTQEELARVALPVIVEPLESIGGEADGGGSGKVQVSTVEEIQEGILQHLSPDLEVGKVRTALAQAANDRVGDVSNTGLDGEQVLGQTAVPDLVLQELDQVAGNGLRGFVLGSIRQRLVRVVRLDNGDDLLRVDRDVGGSNAVLGRHDKVRLPARRNFRHGDIVQTLERRTGRVDLDDDLVGHLDQFRGRTDGSTGNDASILSDGRCLNHSNVDPVLGLVQRVPTLSQLAPVPIQNPSWVLT